jgi:hypothetical protein
MLSAKVYVSTSKAPLQKGVRSSFDAIAAAEVFESYSTSCKDTRLVGEVYLIMDQTAERADEGLEPCPETSSIYRIADFLGEAGKKFTLEPSVKTLSEVFMMRPKIGKSFASYVLCAFNNELNKPLTLAIQEHKLWEVFQAAEHRSELAILVRKCSEIDCAFAARLLVYSISQDSKLYPFNLDQLLIDLKACANSELHDWMFLSLFERPRLCISSALIHLLLQQGSSELIYMVEADLRNRSYALLGDKLPQILSEAQFYSSNEQIYLGRLICAEIAFDRAFELIEGLKLWSDAREGGRAESLLLPYFRVHSCAINVKLAKAILSLSAKYSLFVVSVFSQLAPAVVSPR